jgi:hypothetical protein
MAKTGLAWNGIALATRAENAYWPIALNLGSFSPPAAAIYIIAMLQISSSVDTRE